MSLLIFCVFIILCPFIKATDRSETELPLAMIILSLGTLSPFVWVCLCVSWGAGAGKISGVKSVIFSGVFSPGCHA